VKKFTNIQYLGAKIQKLKSKGLSALNFRANNQHAWVKIGFLEFL